MQFWQTFSVVAALCVEKRPALHDTHVLEPFADTYRPRAQGLQVSLWAAAVILEYRPAPHSSHVVAPNISENRPAGQTMHISVTFENHPGLQDEHQAAPALEYFPMLQFEQFIADFAPAVGKNVPSAQGSQMMEPLFTWYLPR